MKLKDIVQKHKPKPSHTILQHLQDEEDEENEENEDTDRPKNPHQQATKMMWIASASDAT